MSGTLVAVWDETEPEFPGGTADTVYYALPGVSALPDLAGGPSTLSSEVPLVLRVHAASAVPVAEVLSPARLPVWNGNPDEASRQIEAFNREVTKSGATLVDGGFVERLMNAADALAVRLQRRHRGWTVVLLSLGVFAVASVDFQQETETRWFFAVQALGIALMLALWWLLSRLRIKDRFQQCRALAEGARVQRVWDAAGIGESVSDFYLAGLGDDGVWIRRALRAAWTLDCAGGGPRSSRDSIAREWIEGQILYFARDGGAIDRARRKSRRFSWLTLMSIVLAVGGFVPDIMAFVFGAHLPVATVTVCHVMWGVGVAFAAAFVAYSELMGFEQLSRRYRLSAATFRQALTDLDNAVTSEGRRTVIRMTGIEALREAGDWLALHATKDVRPV